MKKMIFCAALICLIAGCAKAPAKPTPYTIYSDFGETIPPVGTSNSVEIGVSMYHDVIAMMDQKLEVSLSKSAEITSEHGEKFTIAAETKGYVTQIYRAKFPAFCPIESGAYSRFCLTDEDRDGVFERAIDIVNRRNGFVTSPVPYSTKLSPLTRANDVPHSQMKFIGTKRELLYQGVSKGTIKISYREFKDSLARPAFTQDVLYDLESDGTGQIAFNGLRIKVLSASNSQISYVLESPLSGSPADLRPTPESVKR